MRLQKGEGKETGILGNLQGSDSAEAGTSGIFLSVLLLGRNTLGPTEPCANLKGNLLWVDEFLPGALREEEQREQVAGNKSLY